MDNIHVVQESPLSVKGNDSFDYLQERQDFANCAFSALTTSQASSDIHPSQFSPLNIPHQHNGTSQSVVESEDLFLLKNEDHAEPSGEDRITEQRDSVFHSTSSPEEDPVFDSKESTSVLIQNPPCAEEVLDRGTISLPPATVQCADSCAIDPNNSPCESDDTQSPPNQCEPIDQHCSEHLKESEHEEKINQVLEQGVPGNVDPASDSSSDEENDDSHDLCDFDQTTLTRLLLLNKCRICGEAFKLRSVLLSHVQEYHNGEGEDEVKGRVMPCMFCSKIYLNEFKLLKHESYHLQKSETVKCLECGNVFENSILLMYHKQRVCEGISCFTCLKEFPNEDCRDNHMKNHHSSITDLGTIDANAENEKDDASSGASTPVSKPKKLRCQYCSKKCSHKKSLLKHEMSHPYGTIAVKCDLCLEVLENYKILKFHKKSERSQVMCSICSMWFPNQKCLSNHTRNSHCTFDDFEDSNSDNHENTQLDNDDESCSSEGSSIYLDALPRYTISESAEPLRITIKQEREQTFPDSPESYTSSFSTPPTPPTPSPKGPPTPSPPLFIPYIEESSDGFQGESSEEDDDDDDEDEEEDESSYTSRGRKKRSFSVSRRKSSLRTSRRVLPSDAYFESSSEASGNDDPTDSLYTPKIKDAGKESDESDYEPDWGRTRSSFGYSRKRGAVLDDESDGDPDWQKEHNSSNSTKKRVTRGRGRGRKNLVEEFPRLIQPKVKRPRARGCGGQKAQDAATALAEAVDEMEFSMPELKVVIRPLKRSLGGSITKASVKRYSDGLDKDTDYLVDVKTEVKQESNKFDCHSSLSDVQSELKNVDDKVTETKDVYSFEEEELQDEVEKVVVKLEPHELVGEDPSKCDELSSGDVSHEFEEGFEPSNNLTSGSAGEDIKEIRYICKFCGRELQYRSHLLRHLRRVHNGEGVDEVMRRLMKCRFCSKPYSNELSLIHHEQLHDGTNKIKCNKCEEVFDDKNALRRHQRKTHWEHQPVECSVCKKQLADNTCLKAHMKLMHTAEERKVTVFTCETCGRQLHTKTAFQNHVASKCGTNLLFPCETCGKSFSFKGSLKAHQLLHTGVKSFLCRFCGKSFHQKGEMKRHERKHTGEKPFVCNVCGRAFAYRESLLGHSAVHTGIKPFPCKACGMRFSCSGNLVKHRRSNNCKGSLEQSDSSSLSVGITQVNTSSVGKEIISNGVTPMMQGATSALNMEMQADLSEKCASVNSTFVSKVVSQTATDEMLSTNTSSAQPVQPQTGRENNSFGYVANPQSYVSENIRMNTSTHTQASAASPPFSCPLPLRGSYNVQSNFSERKLDSVIQSSSQDDRDTAEMKSLMPTLPTSSVIKTNPVAAMKSVPVTSHFLMNMNLKTEPQDELNQPYGVNYASNRSSMQSSAMYDTQGSSALALHNPYGAPSISSTYGESQYRPLNNSTISERHFSQFSTDARIGRNDTLFDRESIIRQEMNRQVIERTVDRQASRLLDCFNGVQFGGLDRRNPMQSFTAATTVSHHAAYPNIHPNHFNNYAPAHSSNPSGSHSSFYGGNAMVPGQVNFPTFSGTGHMSMNQNNQIPAHSVSHPTTHMGHLGAFLGHFGHAPVHPSNSFSRFALSHSMGSPSNPSFPNNHRM